MENKVCKKCQKPLPDGYEYKKCEFCRNEQVQSVKNGLKGLGKVASFVIVVVTIGKINSKK